MLRNISQQPPCIRWRAGNLKWPIRIQQAGKKSSVLTSSKQVWKGFEIRQRFTLEMALNVHKKGIYNFKNHTSLQKVKNMNHFCPENGSPALGMATR